MSNNYSFHIGTSTKLSYDANKEYNEAGAILFTKDTNELFINTGSVSPSNKNYRCQVNSLYATALKGLDANSQQQIFNITDLIEIKNTVDSNKATLDNKMNKIDPLGSGQLIINPKGNRAKNNAYPDLEQASFMVGEGLQQGNSNGNSITSGRYNMIVANALLTIGNGTSNTPKNAFVLIGNTNNSYGVFEGNLYLNSQGINVNESALADNKVLTQKEINDKISTVNTKIDNLKTIPFIISNSAPTDAESKKVFWINTSKGNGVLNYWNGSTWKEISAVFT